MIWSGETFATYLFDPRMAEAALVSLSVAALAQALAVLIGLAAALMLRSDIKIAAAGAGAYVWLFRGTPPLIQLLLVFFGLPQLGIRLGVFEAGLLCLSLYGGAYMAEIIRAGIDSVDAGQIEAARSMGFSRGASLRLVSPQALRIILPPLGNEFTSMMRTTSLLSVISFEELLRVTTLAINETYRPMELYAVAAIYYLAMTSAWMIVQRIWEAQVARPSRAHTPHLTAAS